MRPTFLVVQGDGPEYRNVRIRIALFATFLFFSVNASLATSGDVWVQRNPALTSSSLRAVTFGNGVFVAPGFGGTLVSSRDSRVWIQHSSGTSNRLSGIGFGNNRFVAVGGGAVLLSEDGTSWRNARSVPPNLFLSAVTYGGKRITSLIMTSPDGLVWTKQTTPDLGYLMAICYGARRRYLRLSGWD
jgi:hypothetical protein